MQEIQSKLESFYSQKTNKIITDFLGISMFVALVFKHRQVQLLRKENFILKTSILNSLTRLETNVNILTIQTNVQFNALDTKLDKIFNDVDYHVRFKTHALFSISLRGMNPLTLTLKKNPKRVRTFSVRNVITKANDQIDTNFRNTMNRIDRNISKNQQYIY